MGRKTKADTRREQIRDEYWPKEDLWGEQEPGFFMCPRTLPLVLSLIDLKELSSNKKPSLVYVELLSRHHGQGIIELSREEEHAFAAGYVGARAVRTWRERVQILENLGFIRTKAVGNIQYKYAALVHPTTAVERLKKKGLVKSERWLSAYSSRKIEIKEPTYEQRHPPALDAEEILNSI